MNVKQENSKSKKWNIDELMRGLKFKYKKKKGGSDAWKKEHPLVKKQLIALANKLQSYYINPTPVAIGGSGIILKIVDSRLYNQNRAIKFPRPLPEDAPEFAKLLVKEIKLLSELKSRSIVTIFEAKKIDVEESIAGLSFVPFYVMDFISGSNSDEYLSDENVSVETFISIIKESLEAIALIHSRNLVHLDIKPANIIIDGSGNPIILDLGTTKEINPDNECTRIACTMLFACMEEKRFLKEDPEDPSRAEGTVRRKDIKQEWDIHCFGETLLRWLNSFCASHPYSFSLFTKKYLYLMSIRMIQDNYTEEDEENYGLPIKFLKHIRYKTISEPLEDIKKLQSGAEITETIPELNDMHYKKIQVASGKSTTFTERVSKVLNHPFLRRLSEISQLGICRLVYPTATHSRLEHSLGTFHNTISYICALYNDSLNPLFRQIMNSEDIKTALLFSLLHDIGQFPLAHDLEEIDESIFNHRYLGEYLIKGIKDSKENGIQPMVFPSMQEIFDLWGVSKERLLSIMKTKINNTNYPLKDRILKSIISGPIDADKLDYLLRDSSRLGVPYPKGIDKEHMIQCLTLIVKKHGDGVRAYIGVHEKGKVAAEFVTMSRYAMFSQVYWHHSVRAVKAMLRRAVESLLFSITYDTKEKNTFVQDFEQYVLYKSDRLRHKFQTKGQQRLLFTKTKEVFAEEETKEKLDAKKFEDVFNCSAIDSWDFGILQFFKWRLEEKGLPEATLIEDIIQRKIYKRVFTFRYDTDRQTWNNFSKYWDKPTHLNRKEILREIEKKIVKHIGTELEQNPDTVTITESIIKSIDRVSEGLPLILIDMPTPRPGAIAPLEYILEKNRRELRKSNRVCGESTESKIWSTFAESIRETAGKIRIFVHPDFVESVQLLNKSWFEDTLGYLPALSKTDNSRDSD